jgi:hypothetical protein
MAMMIIMAMVMIADAYADWADMHTDQRGIRSGGREAQRQYRCNKFLHDDPLSRVPGRMFSGLFR